MMESFESPKEILNKETLVELLDAKGPKDPETIAFFRKYIEQCHTEADAKAAANPESAEASNRANIAAIMKAALVYLETVNHKKLARPDLEDVLLAASQRDSTSDLAERARALLEDLGD